MSKKEEIKVSFMNFISYLYMQCRYEGSVTKGEDRSMPVSVSSVAVTSTASLKGKREKAELPGIHSFSTAQQSGIFLFWQSHVGITHNRHF